MALVTCVDCTHQISDQARACPQCGRPAAAAPPGLVSGRVLLGLWLATVALYALTPAAMWLSRPAFLLLVGLVLYTPYWFIGRRRSKATASS